MPAPTPSRLSLLTFPQRWKDGAIRVRFLCLPKGNPESSPAAGQPPYSTANLVFKAHLIGNLDNLPRAADSVTDGPLLPDRPPLNKAPLLAELAVEFKVIDRPVAVAGGAPLFRKPLAASYLALTGDRELSPFIASANDFDCALNEAQASQPVEPVVLEDGFTWGRITAFVLKQPVLAEACGFIGELTVNLPDPAFYAQGGWLYIDLHETSDYFVAAPGFTSVYAARIPALSEDRPLYAAVLFPVDGANPADDVYREAERYSTGFARMVHGAQTDDGGDAIRLAWDDEQVAEWLNRQVDPALNAPMGTSGYRIDVRKAGDAQWNSLQHVVSTGDLMLGPQNLGPFDGDAVVEVAPVQISPSLPGQYWMPAYFATWRGSSLALIDQDLVDLHQDHALDGPDAQPHRLGREKAFVPANDKSVPLVYGNTYEFRVRLADLTRGGPEADVDVPPAADSIATIDFRRRKRPGQISVLTRPAKGSPSLDIARPKLGYPDALFTGKVTFDMLGDDFRSAPNREFGVPDPDVTQVQILVEVRALSGDEAVWLTLYTTQRRFDADEFTIFVETQDIGTLDAFAGSPPEEGALAIPTARDVRLTLTAMGADRANYFDSDDSRVGVSVTVEVRSDAIGEGPLFAPADLPVRGFFFQPPPADGSVANPVDRLAQELELNSSRLTITGRPGHRILLGASANLHHTLAPECAAITFGSNADLIRRWVNVLQFNVCRDWTWDGLAETGLEVRRIIRYPPPGIDVEEHVGTLLLPSAITTTARAGVPADVRAPQRQFTEVFFFDAFDPKPAPGKFPSELRFEYRITTAFKGGVPAPEPEQLPELRVPVTTPPSQTPRLVSAGIALSEYVPAKDYSSTNQRVRSLWIEFEEAPADGDDTCFVRVLADAPDPMLILQDIPDVAEAPLPLDPEWMRLIVPGQTPDNNGLNAMQELTVNTPERRHWIVPLPEGLQPSSPELFGMYTYEIRVGHSGSRWSTAQGRHGPPLRVAGVQHPAPPLVCQAARTATAIRMRAPFATPVYKGQNVRPQIPRTQLWAVLYARVRQLDGASWRNIVLTHAALRPPAAIFNGGLQANSAVLFGEGELEVSAAIDLLRRVGLPDDAPLTVLAVELFGSATDASPAPDPVGTDLGFARIFRVSPLSPVPDRC